MNGDLFLRRDLEGQAPNGAGQIRQYIAIYLIFWCFFSLSRFFFADGDDTASRMCVLAIRGPTKEVVTAANTPLAQAPASA